MKAFIWHDEYEYFIYVGVDQALGQLKYNEFKYQEHLKKIADRKIILDRHLAVPFNSKQRINYSGGITTDEDYIKYYDSAVLYLTTEYEKWLRELHPPDHIVEEGEFKQIDHANE